MDNAKIETVNKKLTELVELLGEADGTTGVVEDGRIIFVGIGEPGMAHEALRRIAHCNEMSSLDLMSSVLKSGLFKIPTEIELKQTDKEECVHGEMPDNLSKLLNKIKGVRKVEDIEPEFNKALNVILRTIKSPGNAMYMDHPEMPIFITKGEMAKIAMEKMNEWSASEMNSEFTTADNKAAN